MKYPCLIAKGEPITYMYEVPIVSIKWIKIPITDSNEVNAFHHGSQIHYKTQSEVLSKQQKVESFLKATQERAKKIKNFKQQQKKKKTKRIIISRRSKIQN